MATKKSNRWGKINHGQFYGLLADDIGRRLATLKLGDYERLLLNHIREYSWARSTRNKGQKGTWPDAILFTDTIDSVAREIASGLMNEDGIRGLRKRLYEAAKGLKDMNILLETDGRIPGLTINTKCDDWKTEGRELLPADVGIAYALEAQKPATEPAKVRPKNPSKDIETNAEDVRQSGHDHIRQSGHGCPPIRADVSANPGTDVRQSGHGPLHRTPASEDLIQINTEEAAAAAGEPSANTKTETPSPNGQLPDHDAAFPAPRSKPTQKPVILNRADPAEPIANTPVQVEALAEFARKTWGLDAAEKARSAAEDFHAADVDAAMRKAKLAGGGWAYASKIMCEWWTETGGRPKHVAGSSPPSRASPNLAPLPPTVRATTAPPVDPEILRKIEAKRSAQNPKERQS